MTVTGSRAVMMYWNDLRIAGAQVRKVLIANAAEKWGVDSKTLKTEPSVVVDPASGRRLSYGEIAAFGKVPATLPAVDKSELKPKSQFRLIGKSVPRRDLPLKVNGTAQYSIDVRLPGMVYASALHSPVHGNAPESWNDAEIKAMPGVIATVKLRNGIGVVAETFAQAMAARRALKVTWSKGKSDGFDSVRTLEGYAKIHADPIGGGQDGGLQGRRQGGVRRCGQDLQGRIPQRLQLPRADGAVERGRALQRCRRQGRGVGRLAGSWPRHAT